MIKKSKKMKSGILLIAAIFLCCGFITSASAKKEMTNKELQKVYLEYLQKEGFEAEIDKDGDISFKFQGGNYYILVDSKDPEFFRIIYPNFWPIETDEEKALVLQAADHSNGMSKTAKIYTVKKNVWATIELFIGEPEDFKGVFVRSLSALQNGVRNFAQEMNRLKSSK